jgi:hypothetical protein
MARHCAQLGANLKWQTLRRLSVVDPKGNSLDCRCALARQGKTRLCFMAQPAVLRFAASGQSAAASGGCNHSYFSLALITRAKQS